MTAHQTARIPPPVANSDYYSDDDTEVPNLPSLGHTVPVMPATPRTPRHFSFVEDRTRRLQILQNSTKRLESLANWKTRTESPVRRREAARSPVVRSQSPLGTRTPSPIRRESQDDGIPRTKDMVRRINEIIGKSQQTPRLDRDAPARLPNSHARALFASGRIATPVQTHFGAYRPLQGHLEAQTPSQRQAQTQTRGAAVRPQQTQHTQHTQAWGPARSAPPEVPDFLRTIPNLSMADEQLEPSPHIAETTSFDDLTAERLPYRAHALRPRAGGVFKHSHLPRGFKARSEPTDLAPGRESSRPATRQQPSRLHPRHAEVQSSSGRAASPAKSRLWQPNHWRELGTLVTPLLGNVPTNTLRAAVSQVLPTEVYTHFSQFSPQEVQRRALVLVKWQRRTTNTNESN